MVSDNRQEIDNIWNRMEKAVSGSFINSESTTKEFIANYSENPFFMEMLDKIEAAAQYIDKPESEYLLLKMQSDNFGDLQNKLFRIGLEDFITGFLYFRSRVRKKYREMKKHPYYEMDQEQLNAHSIADEDFIQHLSKLQEAHGLCMELKRWLVIFTSYCLAGSFLITLLIKKYPDLRYVAETESSFNIIEDIEAFNKKFRTRLNRKKDAE